MWDAQLLALELQGVLIASNAVAGSLLEEFQDGDSTIEIRIEGEFDFNDVRLALKALSRSYELVCPLVGVAPREVPLELIKLETGSLLVIAKGAVSAVGVLKKFFGGFIEHAWVSKRIAGTQQTADAIRAQLVLKQALEQQGIPTDGIAEELSQAAHALAKQTRTLVSAAEEVALDGTFLGLKNDAVKLIEQERNRLRFDPDGNK